MSDNTADVFASAEEPEEEVFDVFETEKAESDFVVKTFDYGIAARQVHREGPDLKIITDEDSEAEREVPELPNNVFNTIMNNLSIVGKAGEKGKAKMSRSESFKVPLLSSSSKKDELGPTLRNASLAAADLSGSTQSLTSLDDTSGSSRRNRARQEEARSRKLPNAPTWKTERKKSIERLDTRATRKFRPNEAKNTGVRSREVLNVASTKFEASKGLKTSRSTPSLRSQTGKNATLK